MPDPSANRPIPYRILHSRRLRVASMSAVCASRGALKLMRREGRMNFVEAVKSGFQNYVHFSARASRSEYWYWWLFCILLGIVVGLMDGVLFPDSNVHPITTICELIVVLTFLSVSIR